MEANMHDMPPRPSEGSANASTAHEARQPEAAQVATDPASGDAQAASAGPVPTSGSATAGTTARAKGAPQHPDSPAVELPTRDHVVAGLLALFLGSLGLHKFYLGYNDVGFVMLAITVVGSLLSFGLAGAIMWVFGIVEGIIYLSKSQTAFEAEYVHGRREWF